MAGEDNTPELTLAEFAALSGDGHAPTKVPLETRYAIRAVEDSCAYLKKHAAKLEPPRTKEQALDVAAPSTPTVDKSFSKGYAKPV